MIVLAANAANRRQAEHTAEKLREQGQSVRIYDDGLEMEHEVRSGTACAVMDWSPLDVLMNQDRLTAAGMMTIPQAIVLGGFDDAWTAEALDLAGKLIAERVSAARGPTRIFLTPDAPTVLVQSLRNWCYPPTLLVDVPHATCDPALSEVLIRFVLEQIVFLKTHTLPTGD